MRRLLLALLPAALIGCDALSPRECTLIGCTSGILVTFASPPTQPYRVELLLGDDATEPALVEECTRADGRCGSVFFPIHDPGERARLRVTTATGTVTTTARPLDYVRSQPNGRDCPPTCYLATLEAALPPASAEGARVRAAT